MNEHWPSDRPAGDAVAPAGHRRTRVDRMEFNVPMGVARARRIATRVHRGQLFGGSGPFVAHLDRVARSVGESGGGGSARQAAWLYAAPRAGIPATDLYRMGVPARVVGIVDTLHRRIDEDRRTFTDRVLAVGEAALVWYAVLTDMHHTLAGRHAYERWRDEHARLAAALGLPGPATGTGDTPPTGLATLAEPGDPAAERPGDGRHVDGEHWAEDAYRLGARGDADAVTRLVDAYRAETAGHQRQCCLSAIRSALFTAAGRRRDATPQPLRELARRWWEATDDWECLIAVTVLATAADPTHRPLLLDKIDTARPWVTATAIRGLTGPGDAREIELLGQVVSQPGAELRWARRAAANRLIAIGGVRAAAALRARCLSPLDPPWRDDPRWLAEHGTEAIPTLIDKLDDRDWWHEAPYALGELRAVAAVPALCRLAGACPGACIPAIEALGKIGSTDAVPTLVSAARYPRPEVRDHALRALDRIGCPDAVDASISACDDPHPVVRDRAARVLARRGDGRAVTALIRLCDTRHVVRAVRALARIGDPRALPTLWRLFVSAPERAVRHGAGRGIAAIDGPREYVYLPTADVHLRRAYAWLLGHKPTWSPRDVLVHALTDDDALVRANAATALGRLGGPADPQPVRSLLDDPDPRVRAHAATALARLPGTTADDLVDACQRDPHPQVRSAATAALRRLAPARPASAAPPASGIGRTTAG